MANAIMRCKYWLGFNELTQEDVVLEQALAEDCLSDVDAEGENDDKITD